MAINDPIIGSELHSDFDQGVAFPNEISVNIDTGSLERNGSDQIAAKQATMSFVPGTGILTHTSGNGTAQNIDLSSFLSDIYVSGATFDAATNVLTLTDADAGTPDVTVDLSNLLGVSADAGNLLQDGTDGKPLFTKADLDAQTTILVSRFGTQIGRIINV